MSVSHIPEILYDEMREASERQASSFASDLSVKAAHDALASLYRDRAITARQALITIPKG